jgi:hypothetical protein
MGILRISFSAVDEVLASSTQVHSHFLHMRLSTSLSLAETALVRAFGSLAVFSSPRGSRRGDIRDESYVFAEVALLGLCRQFQHLYDMLVATNRCRLQRVIV